MPPKETAIPTAPAEEERKEERKEQGRPVSMPRLPLPGLHAGMPTGMPGRVLWWGGLAALAAFEVVEWPVAVLVGAGSWVAERYAKAAQSQRAEQRQASEHMPPSARR